MTKKIAELGPYAYCCGVPDVVDRVAQGGVYYVTVYDDGAVQYRYSTGAGRSCLGKRWPAVHSVSRRIIESHPEIGGKLSDAARLRLAKYQVTT